MTTDPNETGSDLERLVLLAICDPGAFLARGDNYTESIPHWGMRAVLAVLAKEGKVVVDRADLVTVLEDSNSPAAWPARSRIGAALFASALAAEGARCPEATEPEPLIDPDCRDGKCGSCFGGPCEHHCHKGASK